MHYSVKAVTTVESLSENPYYYGKKWEQNSCIKLRHKPNLFPSTGLEEKDPFFFFVSTTQQGLTHSWK